MDRVCLCVQESSFVLLCLFLFLYLFDLFTIAADKTVRIWSTLDGAFEAMLEGHQAGQCKRRPFRYSTLYIQNEFIF